MLGAPEFRPADVGTVVALVTAINQAVFAFAPAIFDSTDGYLIALLMAGAAQLLAAIIVLCRPSHDFAER